MVVESGLLTNAAFTLNGFETRNETWRLWKPVSKF